jgi:hypothetical protein
MIEMLLVAATTIQTINLKKQDEKYLSIERKNVTSTIKGFEDYLTQLKVGTSTATYQTVPVVFTEDEDDFVSPVKKSITVNATFIFGEKILPLPIDDDDIVYFDE